MTNELQLLKLKEVLGYTSLGRSTFLQGVKDGRFPKPVRLSARRVAWRLSDIQRLITAQF